MANFLMGLISLSVGVVLLANVFIQTLKGTVTCVPGALGATCNGTPAYGTNATGVGGYAFTTAESSLWGLIALLGIAGMVYGVLNIFGLA